MSKIIIIGSSIAGHSTAVKLREQDKEASITILTEEKYPFYDRRRLLDFLAGTVKEKELILCDEDFYRKNNINFLKEKKISAIGIKKNLVYLKEKENLAYDFLIICSGTRIALPEVSGVKKEGVYTLTTLGELKDFSKSVILGTVCVVGSSNLAFQAAKIISSRYKVEVKLFGSFNLEESLPKEIEILNNEISEIIGEGEVKAIKLKEGKIIGACAVIFTGPYKPNTDFLKNSDVELGNDFILVDESMRTNIENIFSAGSVAIKKPEAQKQKTWDEVINESNFLADNLLQNIRKGQTCQTY